MKKYPISRKDNLVVQEMNGEVIVYDLNKNKALCLNETAALVWEACDGGKSTEEISRFIAQKMNTPADENLVWLALDQLKKENLLNNAEDIKIDFNGLSRRDAIRKVGFASLAALPVIMAISAPVAAASASVCGLVLGMACFGADAGCTLLNIGAASPDQTQFIDGCNIAGAHPGCTCNGTGGGPFICSSLGVRTGSCS